MKLLLLLTVLQSLASTGLGADHPVGDKGLTNSLGMKLELVPGTSVLMCVHETRNADYAAYAAAQSGVNEEWKEEAGRGKEQHPVVNVDFEDAEGFCRWLSAKEGKTYRLPTDAEWSAAVGLHAERGATPNQKYINGSINGPKDAFPWGTHYPPKPGDGNYKFNEVHDGFDGTAPVMSFRANELGIYDLGGNVWEWCQDRFDDSAPFSSEDRVLRGASSSNNGNALLNSWFRGLGIRGDRLNVYGFRCVLVVADS